MKKRRKEGIGRAARKKDEQQKPLGMRGIVRNITERRRMQEELETYSENLEQLVSERTGKLADSERRFRELVDLLPQIVFEIDLNGNLAFLNRAGFESTGYTEEDLRQGVNLFVPEDHDRAMEYIRKIVGGEKSFGDEFAVSRKYGTPFSLLLYGAPVTREGRPVGLRGVAVDITERKQMEEERAETIRKLNEAMALGLVQKTVQMENISQLREKIRQAPDLSTGLDLILNTALNDLDMDVGAVLVIDRDEKAVKVAAVKSRIEGFQPEEQYSLDAAYVELEAVTNDASSSRMVKSSERSILRTKIVSYCPIFHGRQTYGLLAVGSQGVEPLDEGELRILKLHSDLASALFETRDLTVVPVRESALPVGAPPEIEMGEAYLVKENVEKAYEVFVGSVMSGMEGLCITRECPAKLRTKYGLKKTPIVWLTGERFEGETTVHSLQDLSVLISSFLEKTQNTVVLLDGLEYLVTNHGFEPCLRFLQVNRNRFQAKNSTLIAPLFPAALSSEQAKLIERETKPLA